MNGDKTFTEIKRELDKRGIDISIGSLHNYLKGLCNMDIDGRRIVEIIVKESKYGKRKYYHLNIELLDPAHKIIIPLKSKVERWYLHIIKNKIDIKEPLTRYVILRPGEEEYLFKIPKDKKQEILEKIHDIVIELDQLIDKVVWEEVINDLGDKLKKVYIEWNKRMMKLLIFYKKAYKIDDEFAQEMIFFRMIEFYELFKDRRLKWDKENNVYRIMDTKKIKIEKGGQIFTLSKDRLPKKFLAIISQEDIEFSKKEYQLLEDYIKWYSKNQREINEIHKIYHEKFDGKFYINAPSHFFAGYRGVEEKIQYKLLHQSFDERDYRYIMNYMLKSEIEAFQE